jgi:excisionase family DNA binding protein
MADEVAAELRVTPKTVRKLAKSGQLPAIKIGREWRFRQADVDAFGAGELIPAIPANA